MLHPADLLNSSIANFLFWKRLSRVVNGSVAPKNPTAKPEPPDSGSMRDAVKALATRGAIQYAKPEKISVP
jgi:hypothetical protein